MYCVWLLVIETLKLNIAHVSSTLFHPRSRFRSHRESTSHGSLQGDATGANVDLAPELKSTVRMTIRVLQQQPGLRGVVLVLSENAMDSFHMNCFTFERQVERCIVGKLLKYSYTRTHLFFFFVFPRGFPRLTTPLGSSIMRISIPGFTPPEEPLS